MAEDLKQVEPKEEQVRPTPEKEQVRPTQPEAKDTPLGRTFSEAEFKKAQSGWQRQIDLAKQEAAKIRAEAEQSRADVEEARMLREQAEQELEKMLADNPEDRQSFLDRRAIARERVEVARIRREAERLSQKASDDAKATLLGRKAIEVSREYGIPVSDLENCGSEYEMENLGLKYQIEKSQERESEEKTPPQKFDSNISSVSGGVDWTIEKIREMAKDRKGLADFEKNLDQILKAAREGKIK